MARDRIRLSRLVAKVLRHEPGLVGCRLESGGWMDIDLLLQGLARLGYPLSRQSLGEILAPDEKVRFEIDGNRVRAVHGHSHRTVPAYLATTPPDVLFHGTAASSLLSIRAAGLVPGRRRFVHLSVDPDNARRVGERHGPAVVIVVDAIRMHAEGLVFYLASSGVWLSDAVPPQYLREP